MKRVPVARRYAKALLEIGVERGIEDRLREQLGALSRAYGESQEFRNTMLNPSIKLDERKDVMRKIAERYNFDPITRNFTLLLLDNERFRYIAEITQEYLRQADVRAGRVRAKVSSAAELSMVQKTELKAQLKRLTGAQQIELETSVDAALLGGVVARVGGMVLDGSVRTQLESLRESILSEA